MILHRILDLPKLLDKKSFFLFGPRATGKSFLIRQQLGEHALILNLLRNDLYMRLLSNPHELSDIINADKNKKHSVVVIDEVQRVPELLNEVHRLIEEEHVRFLLTGSSARKLLKANVNLLGGRAWQASLFPLTTQEIPDFNFEKYLRFGGLPPVYLSDDPEEELIAYVDTYLREEIRAEALVRKIPSFTRFLQVAAVSNGKILNFSNLSNDAAVPLSTLRDYYQILQDTFLGFMLQPWQKSIKRKAITSGKFFFFDLGVTNVLANKTGEDLSPDAMGDAFEHFIILEIRAYLSYRRIKKELSFWHSIYKQEVDVIIGDDVAIEIKATKATHDKHMKGLKALAEEKICQHYILVSQDKIERVAGEIECIHWETFLRRLWAGEIV